MTTTEPTSTEPTAHVLYLASVPVVAGIYAATETAAKRHLIDAVTAAGLPIRDMESFATAWTWEGYATPLPTAPEGYNRVNRCNRCDAHISEPHQPTCLTARKPFVDDDGITWEPWTDGHAVGFKVIDADGSVEYVYLNPSPGGPGQGRPNAFVYTGTHGNVDDDGPIGFVEVLYADDDEPAMTALTNGIQPAPALKGIDFEQARLRRWLNHPPFQDSTLNNRTMLRLPDEFDNITHNIASIVEQVLSEIWEAKRDDGVFRYGPRVSQGLHFNEAPDIGASTPGGQFTVEVGGDHDYPGVLLSTRHIGWEDLLPAAPTPGSDGVIEIPMDDAICLAVQQGVDEMNRVLDRFYQMTTD